MAGIPAAPAEEPVLAPETEAPVPQEEEAPVPAPTEGPDEGAEPPADEGEPNVEEELLQFIEELKAEDPELAAKAEQRLGIQTPDERIFRMQVDQATAQLQALRQAKWQEHQQVSPVVIQHALKNEAKKIADEAKAAAEAYAQGQTDKFSVDLDPLADRMAAVTTRSAMTAYTLGQTELETAGFQELINSPTQFYLTAQDWQALDQAARLPTAAERLAASMRVHLYAVARLQPDQQEALAKQQEAQQEKRLKNAERLQKLMGAKGSRAMKGANAPAHRSERDALLDPRTPISELERIRSRQRAG